MVRGNNNMSCENPHLAVGMTLRWFTNDLTQQIAAYVLTDLRGAIAMVDTFARIALSQCMDSNATRHNVSSQTALACLKLLGLQHHLPIFGVHTAELLIWIITFGQRT